MKLERVAAAGAVVLAAAAAAAGPQFVLTDSYNHFNGHQAVTLWDVDSDGDLELVVGGNGHGVYDPSNIAAGPLALTFNFLNIASGADRGPDGILRAVDGSGSITRYGLPGQVGSGINTPGGLAIVELNGVIISLVTSQTSPLMAIRNASNGTPITTLNTGVEIGALDYLGVIDGGHHVLAGDANNGRVFQVDLGPDLSTPVWNVVDTTNISGTGSILGVHYVDGLIYIESGFTVGVGAYTIVPTPGVAALGTMALLVMGRYRRRRCHCD